MGNYSSTVQDLNKHTEPPTNNLDVKTDEVKLDSEVKVLNDDTKSTQTIPVQTTDASLYDRSYLNKSSVPTNVDDVKTLHTRHNQSVKNSHLFVIMEDKEIIAYTRSLDKAKLWVDKRCAEEMLHRESDGLESWHITTHGGSDCVYKINIYDIPVLWILFARTKVICVKEVKHISQLH